MIALQAIGDLARRTTRSNASMWQGWSSRRDLSIFIATQAEISLRTRIWKASIRQGITTALDGNDGGGSPLPLDPFLEKVAESKPLINFGWFVGHGSIRIAVMGTVNRHALREELARMRDLARSAMSMERSDYRRVCFMCRGITRRLRRLSKSPRSLAALGGMHISHMRDEAAGILDSVRETIRIGEEGKLPTQVTHHKIIGGAILGQERPDSDLIEEARARGVDVSSGSISVHGIAHRFRGDVSAVVARRWPDGFARAVGSAGDPGPHQGGSRSADSRRSRGRGSQECSVQSV